MVAARSSARGRDRNDRDDDREERGGRGGGGKRKSGFSYRGRSSEDVSRRAKQSSGRYDSFLTEEVTWYKPRADENQVRIIPWLNGDDPDFDALAEKWGTHWGIDIIVHRNVGPDNGTYLCNDKMNGEPCPPCDAYRDGEDDLRGSDRVLCWLIDRKNEKAGPQLWAMPLGVSKDISNVSQPKGGGPVLLIDNPDEGYDIFFDKEGEKKRTEYKRIEVDRDPSPLHENEKKQQAWLDYISERRLPDLLKFYDADYLDKVLSGQKEQKEEDEDDDGSGRSSRRRSRGRGGDADDAEGTSSRPSRRGRGDADEEDEGGSRRPRRSGRRDPEEDPEEETSSRSSRSRGRGAEPEEDPEDEPEESGRGRSERASGRSGRRGGADEPEERSSRRARGRVEPEEDPEEDPEEGAEDEAEDAPRSGGRTERYRGGGKGKSDPEDDKTTAKERLGRVGRRNRG